MKRNSLQQTSWFVTATLAPGILFVSSFLLARTITVDDDGPAEFSRIQHAINAAAAGDLISVAAGTYRENLSLSCVPDKIGVSIVGAGYATTTVDGGGTGSVATLWGCDAGTRLEGFTLTNGAVYGGDGGGVNVVFGAPIIRHNLITGNQAAATAVGGAYYCYAINPGKGGGVAVKGGAPLITLNQIIGNRAEFVGSGICAYPASGGGVSVSNSDATVSQNLIANNMSGDGGWGGGIVSSGGSPLITRNEISGNRAGSGAGISLFSNAIVTNNLITGNTASLNGGGVLAAGITRSADVINNTIVGNVAFNLGGGVSLLAPSQTVVNNNIVHGNRASSGGGGMFVETSEHSIASNIFHLNSPESCAGGFASLCSGSGNLTADPLLVDPAGGDHRLRAGSPAIDSGLPTGAPATDLRGQRRPLDGDFDGTPGFDRGAFEFDRDGVLGLRFGTPELLVWDPTIGATAYHMYSGALDSLRRRGLDTCRDSEDSDRSDLAFTETQTPPVGSALAYVVTAVVGGAEGSPGFNSLGLERTFAVQCCSVAACTGDPCPPGYLCGFNGCCTPHCFDGIRDGDEGDVDCGGSCVADCAPGQHCYGFYDCASGICVNGICQ